MKHNFFNTKRKLNESGSQFRKRVNTLNKQESNKIFFCHNCDNKLKYEGAQKTDWYGILEYYRCVTCKEDLIRKEGKKPEIK